MAAALTEAGVSRGSRVALVLPAGVDFALAAYCCLRLGACLVPLSQRAPSAALLPQLSDSSAALVIGGGRDGAGRTAARAAGVPYLLIESGAVVGSRGGQVRLETGKAPADELAVVYTSGTTGAPKGVRQTLGNHIASAMGCRDSLSIEPGEPWLLVLPPHHVGGLAIFMRGLLGANPVVALPSFAEAEVIDALARYRPSLVSLVPAQLRRLLAAGGLSELCRARALLLGGGPAPTDEVTEWVSAGLPVCPSYGLTETCSQVCSVPPGMAAAMAGTVGPAHPYAQVEIRTTSTRRAEVWVGGAVLSPGYTHSDGRGWDGSHMFPTGDVGELTREGWLRVTGRLDDTILTGGENVDPTEVEAMLAGHPLVQDIAVLGIADPIYGLRVAAVVVGDVSSEQLQVWALERLPSFKVPRVWARADVLPRTESGKLQRRLLGEFF